MAEYEERQEARKKIAQDYYAGYYWGNDTYGSFEVHGRKSDAELKSSILEPLRVCSSGPALDYITILVDNGIIVLTGHVKIYRERRLEGAEVWRTCRVVNILNEVRGTEPETAWSSKVLQEMC
jgi:osmotically-inducible protein OsmY